MVWIIVVGIGIVGMDGYGRVETKWSESALTGLADSSLSLSLAHLPWCFANDIIVAPAPLLGMLPTCEPK